MIYKLIYFLLFSSIDALLYLRLSMKFIKAERWLIALAVVWLCIFIIHLPAFRPNYLMPLNWFCTLSGMVVQLILIHYVGLYSIGRMERSQIPENVKENANKIQGVIFNKLIFAFFIFIHLIFVLSWSNLT